MATDTVEKFEVEKSDLDIFKRYIDERYGGSLHGHSLAKAIEEFREYQRQLSALQERLRLAEASADREGTRALTVERLDKLCNQWESELKEEGVIE